MQTILLRYGELTLKGNNRKLFERILLQNIHKKFAKDNIVINKDRNRIYLRDVPDDKMNTICQKIQTISGIHSYAIVHTTTLELEDIKNEVLMMFNPQKPIFRVTVKRLYKEYPLDSGELQRQIGAHILINNDGLENMKVSMKNFEQEIKIEIHQKEVFIFNEHIMAFGGLPLGSAGKATVLLSGGIDSPVAAILAMKRGLKINVVHFSSPPYTSSEAFDKIKSLVKILHQYDCEIKLFDINLTKIQEEISDKCNNRYQVILSRKMMMRIAEKVAKRSKSKALITGENLAQVASQTVESMTVTNSSVEMLIFRPLIMYDKVDIITLAKKYGTFETSILPFEDSCTVFLPEKPIIHPKINDVVVEEEKFDYEKLLTEIEYKVYLQQDLVDDFSNLEKFIS